MTRSPPASPEARPDAPPDTPPQGTASASAGGPSDAREIGIEGADEVLDVRGLMCPLPVLKARKVLKRLAPGATLAVLATDPAAVIDFRHFCETTPFALLGWHERAGTYAFRIRVPG